MAKRKLKQSQSAIKGRLYYQKSLLKKVSSEYALYSNRNNKSKVLFRGKKRTHKTISDILINEAKLINNKISEIENKLKRYKEKTNFKKLNKEELTKKKIVGKSRLKEIGNIWHRKEFDQNINLSRNKIVNGLDKSKDHDKIQSLSDEMFLRMDSTDIACILEFDNNTCEIFLLKEYKPEKKAWSFRNSNNS